jgi:N,N'-diacetyllegionaminate synthase
VAIVSSFSVGPRRIGGGAPCFVIAEAGVNHNGELELARRLVDAAAEAGADAVKFQTFDPEQLASDAAPQAEYQKRGSPAQSQRGMLEKLRLSPAAHHELRGRAESRGLIFMSSPFDERSVDFLDELGVPAFKVPSGEVTNHPLLQHLARKGRPILMSTGMCTLAEVAAAVAVIRASGDPPLALFHCVSAYPTDPADSNLRAMATLRGAFVVPVGWSDHTDGIEIAIAATALGAELLEKHLTLDRNLPGPDHRASLEPAAFAEMTRVVRVTERALGDGVKAPRPAEAPIAAVARKSLHYAAALPAGSRLRREDLVALRPGTGISPSRIAELVGRPLRRDVRAGALASEGDCE